MTEFAKSLPQQQQELQQAQQQQQMLKLSPAVSLTEARAMFLRDELSRVLTENGFIVHSESDAHITPVPRGVTVKIEHGMVYAETDVQVGQARMREKFRLNPQSNEGAPKFILSRYQFPTWSGLDVEPDYYAHSLKPLSLTDGLPDEMRSVLGLAAGNN